MQFFLYGCIQQTQPSYPALSLFLLLRIIKRLTGAKGKNDVIVTGKLRRIDGFCSDGFWLL